MREFTKSMVSFSWAMSLFGIQQVANVFTRPDPNRPKHKTTEAFDSVTQSTEAQLGDILKETFKAGDKLQRQMVGMMFGSFMPRGMNPGQMMGMASDTMRTASGCCGQGRQGSSDGMGQEPKGWGPMPSGMGDSK